MSDILLSLSKSVCHGSVLCFLENDIENNSVLQSLTVETLM